VDGVPCLDLDYGEDSKADVDMNLVMTGRGLFVEIQGTAEKTPFSSQQLKELLALGTSGINQLIERQKASLRQRVGYSQLFRSA